MPQRVLWYERLSGHVRSVCGVLMLHCYCSCPGEDCRIRDLFPEDGVGVVDYQSVMADDAAALALHASRVQAQWRL